MPLLLLMLLIFICLMKSWPPPFHWLFEQPLENAETRSLSLALTGVTMMTMVLVAWLIARWTRWSLHHHPEARETILGRYATLRFLHFLSLFGAFLAALYIFGWGWTLMPAGGAVWPLAELVLLIPLLAAMVLSWACFYDSERAIHDSLHPYITAGRPFWSRLAYVGFHSRQNLALVLVPMLLVVGLQEVERRELVQTQTLEFQALSFGLLAAMFLSMPLLLRPVMGWSSLPAGPLRQRLEEAARRLRFRCGDILVWNTRQGVANALVVGLLPKLRYVVLSDRLLTDLSAEEVEAVFGHEVGHVKHHHMLFYLGFLFVSLAVLAGIWEYLAVEQPGPLMVGSLVLYIFVVFGFLSRRCERQADIHGCRTVSCNQPDCQGHDGLLGPTVPGQALCPTGIKTFIPALEKVAILNGMSRNRPGWLQSWQHSTIARRVEFLQQLLTDPALEWRFQRRVALVKWLLMIGLCTLLGILTWTLGQSMEAPSIDSAASGEQTPKPPKPPATRAGG